MRTRHDREIRSRRPPKPQHDAWRPLDVHVEHERGSDGRQRRVAVLFLVGRECPFTCVFCDLWRFTLSGSTPPGSLPVQIDRALTSLGDEGVASSGVKLYNASNFFDPLAVPDADLEAIAARLERFQTITVESHPLLVGRRALEMAARLTGELEVAMGLESVHPEVLPRLNKRMSVGDFDRATERLLAGGAAVRAFVLLGVPFLEPEAQVDWAVRSAEHALEAGARHVSLIPVRGGNGELERLAARGDWRSPSLAQLEQALEALVGRRDGAVTADTWDLGRLAACPECLDHRRGRLESMNLTGDLAARSPCPACGWS